MPCRKDLQMSQPETTNGSTPANSEDLPCNAVIESGLSLENVEAIYSLELQKHRLLIERYRKSGSGEPPFDMLIRPRRAA